MQQVVSDDVKTVEIVVQLLNASQGTGRLGKADETTQILYSADL
jgi:hypothetical protein